MEKNSGSGGVQSLDRAFDLLELLCRSQNGMAIHQLSEITGLHKSTVHRPVSYTHLTLPTKA